MAGAPQFPSRDPISVTAAGAMPKSLYDDLQKLCKRIQTLSTSKFLLHPSKCRCLLQSYRLLLHRGFLSHMVSCSSSAEGKLDPLLRDLLHTVQEGERFLEICTFWRKHLIIPHESHERRKWLINAALPIVLSTEVVDVHLHDFVVCIFTLTCMVIKVTLNGHMGHGRPKTIWNWFPEGDWKSTHWVEAYFEMAEVWLQEAWVSADDKEDARRMQELFSAFKATEHEEIYKLMCGRLSESTSTAQLYLAAGVVPTYLWMDPPGFDQELEKKIHALNNHQSVVASIESMGGRFACKHFQWSASEEEFTNEAVIQASLRHANVMQVLWCTRRAESHSLVMELMDETLGHAIQKRRSSSIVPPFSLLAGIDIMLQIAKGMEYLHSLGIIHRDLKSFNILVRHSRHADDRDRLTIKIADFGTSKVKNNTSLFTTKRVGTSIWRAPEVVDSEDETKYTNKADVYSFAIVCSEILTGLGAEELLPCKRMSDLHRVLREGRRPQLPSSCPPAIASYIQKCWHGDASERPTFMQICRMFRFFKACLLLGETGVLASTDPHMFNFKESVLASCGFAAQSQGRYYHPILRILPEMEHMLDSVYRRRGICPIRFLYID